ncbi:MAG TPA: SseB family protein [Solirubrobacteraceae bacterium]|nr:SseB family protein [Solirubrobacteraceae bacterium]
MRRVAEQDTRETRQALFELLLGATLTAASVDNPPPGAERGLAMLESNDGPVLPVFTGVDALRAWRASGYTPFPVPGRTLFEMAARYDTSRIEVNPASVPRGWISRTEIAALAEGRIPVGPTEERGQPSQQESGQQGQAGQVMVGRASVRPPEALIEAARRALESQPHAVAGWLFVITEGSDSPQLMVGVELARGIAAADVDATMQAILEETWARSNDADQLRFMLVADRAFRETLTGGAGELIYTR